MGIGGLVVLGLPPGFVRLIVMSELEAAGEALGSASSTSWHPPEALEASSASASAATASHLGTEHLHEDLGIDLHTAASTHALSSSMEAFHGVDEVFATVVASTFPTLVLVK